MTTHRTERPLRAPLPCRTPLVAILCAALALSACGKDEAAPAGPAQAPAAPALTPTPAAETVLHARFVCESGSFRVLLATKEAPTLCANFINLVGRGYYDGQAWGDFSRVVRQTVPGP